MCTLIFFPPPIYCLKTSFSTKKDFLFIRESLMKHIIEELLFNERVGRALSSQFISEHPGSKRHSYQSNHHHRQ